MQYRVLRHQQALFSLLQRLNDCCPQSETRRLLPELCVFVDSLLPQTVIPNTNIIVLPLPLSSSIIRRAFRHPKAHWLSRSARQSGISALLCQQLVRLARQDDDNKSQGNCDNTIYWSAPELVMHVFLDALLSSCAERLGEAPDACKWRPLQPKPRFHAMTCFPVWSALLPFVALMGIRYPETFEHVLKTYQCMETTSCNRVNCEFAQVRGIWKLVEELDRSDKKKQKAVTKVMATLLRLASDRVLRCGKEDKDGNKLVDWHLDDQLLEKFVTGIQQFSFNSWRADEMLKHTLLSAFAQALKGIECGAKVGVVPQRVVVFTTAACMLVKDLAANIVLMVIKHINDIDAFSGDNGHPLLTFLVGFCAHVDLVPLTSVLEALGLLVTLYRAVTHNAADREQQQNRQHELVFYIAYVTLCRSKSVDNLREEVSSDAEVVVNLLKRFQIQLCSEIAYEDFQIAVPVHWMARVWKHWVFLSDSVVQVFVSEAQEKDRDTEQEFKKRVATWQMWESLIAFRLSSFTLFTQMKTLVRPHLISAPFTDLDDEIELDVRARKRRRTETKCSVSPNQLECSFDVLLLPDVMERVCSFLSAKRLCRMTLVCRDFAKVSHRASLWRQLYLRIGSSIRARQNDVPVVSVECHHGGSYKHNWRQMYQERWKVLRRLRRMIKAKQSSGYDEPRNSGEALSSIMRTNMFMPLMCTYCGCNQVLRSTSEQAVHEARHTRFTCMDRSCQASFSSLHKFKQHVEDHRTKSVVRSSAACHFICGYEGCKKRYLSAKRLATHYQKENHASA